MSNLKFMATPATIVALWAVLAVGVLSGFSHLSAHLRHAPVLEETITVVAPTAHS